MKRTIFRLAGLALLLACGLDSAQGQSQSVQQSGPVSAGHTAGWLTNGILQDAGTATNPNLTTLGLYGTGTPFCISNTKVRTGQYYQLCMGYATGSTAGVISLTPFGGAPDIPLNIVIDGVTYSIGGGGNWLSAIFDQQFGSTPGDMLCRGATAWGALTPGAAGQILTSNGTNACPQWTAPGGTTTPLLRVVSTGTADTAQATDGTIAWNSASASGKTEALYACGTGSNGKVLYIKDARGTANTYPITLAPNGSDTIDGASIYTIAFSYQSVMLQCFGSSNMWMTL